MLPQTVANDLNRLSSPSFFNQKRRKRHTKKGDFQHGNETDHRAGKNCKGASGGGTTETGKSRSRQD